MAQSAWELIRLSLKLGTISFGGPAAHIALMQDEVVHRCQWISGDQFLDLWSATNLIPGPNALKVATYIGYRRAGLAGAAAAAVSFTLPAALITLLLAWMYQAYRQVPQAGPFLHGIKPAALAIIVVAAYRLGKTAFKDWRTGLIGVAALAAARAGLNDIAVLLAAGAIGAVFLRVTERRQTEGPLLDAVNAASIGLIASLVISLGRTSLIDWQSILIAVAAASAVLLWKAPFAMLVLGGGLAGLLLS